MKNTKQAHELVKIFRKYFLNRIDVVAAKTGRGKPAPIFVDDIDKTLLSHLTGQPITLTFRYMKDGKLETWKEEMPNGARIGTYTPTFDGKTILGCIDIDGAEKKANPVKNPDTALRTITEILDSYSISYTIERSLSGAGWHIWIFFADAVEAALLRKLLHILVPKDIPLANGGFADPQAGKGIEIFPKSDNISEMGVGHMVYLPKHHSAKGGTNAFYFFNGDKLLVTESPSFSPNPPEIITDLLFELLAKNDPVPPSAKRAEEKDNVWVQWRQTALAKLDLTEVYGKILTGKVPRSGWLECRDPDSPTGDKNPSAGVNDSDTRCERGIFHSFRTGTSISIFDYMVKDNQAKDFFQALKIVSEKSSIPLPRFNNGSSGFPEILVNCRQPREVIENFWNVLHVKNQKDMCLFRKGNFIVEPSFDEFGNGSLAEVSVAKMSGLLIRCADLMKRTVHGFLPAILPDYIPKDMTTIPDEKLPPLNTITGSPYFSKSGQLIISPGYHQEDEVFLKYPVGFLPDEIGIFSADEARGKIDWFMDELLCDFPFASEPDKTHALAAFFQPLLRKMIIGPAPMFLINAPIPGSGKSLLARLIGMLVTGQDIAARVLSGSEEERKKMFLSELLRGKPIILLDNLDDENSDPMRHTKTNKLHCPSLAAILTSTVYSDRVLGISKMIEVPNEALWIMTGNNPQLSAELSRRCIWIRIDAETERPWERNEDCFKHPELLKWTKEKRSQLLNVLLSAILSWIQAGKPIVEGETLGSYESWSKEMCSLLAFLGFDDFLSNQNKVEIASDPFREIWVEVFAKCFEHFRNNPVTTGDILRELGPVLLAPLVGQFPDDASKKISLGKHLSKQKGCIYGGYRLILVPHSEKESNRYVFIPVLKKKKKESGENRGDFEDLNDLNDQSFQL